MSQDIPPPAGCAFRLEVSDDAEALSARAAAFLAARFQAAPSMLFCAATGSTPTRTYERLVAMAPDRPGLFDRLRLLKLDEWGGLPPDDAGTCETYLQRHLAGPLGIPTERYFAFRSDAADPGAESLRVQRILAAEGPVDLCLLGLGLNGHLALNEPAEALQARAHVAPLDPGTREHPMIRHLGERPRFGLTLGMADILQAREILLLVNGSHKREVLQRLLAGGISTRLPASFLHLHPAVTLMCDRAALPDA
jgi:galactosamine-6-phosphate isomerase